jgi:hypothetical protein
MGCLLDALERAYRVLGFAGAADGDDVFAQLVLARIIEPVSKPDSLRVLEEAGVAAALLAGRRRPRRSRRPRTPRFCSTACAATTRAARPVA